MDINEANKIIRERCPRCEYGAFKRDGIFCSHPYHRGWMGGYGTISFAQCLHFKDRGKIGRIKEVLTFEGEE